MTQIRQRAFSHRIVEYLQNAETFNEHRFDSSLYEVVSQNHDLLTDATTSVRGGKVMRGLSFSEHIGLVMVLIARAYCSLTEQTGIEPFSRAMAKALQTYAEPLIEGDYACFPYPHFLLHGLRKMTTAEVVRKLEENGRIIHETLAARVEFMARHGGPVYLEQNVKMLMEEGATEDTSGICCYLARASEQQPHGTDCTYIAKVSFFLDMSKKEIVVITIQGQRVQRGNSKRSRAFARLGRDLQMDPRTYLLKKICEIGRGEGYQKIKVIRPLEHPMFLDKHSGFKARYEPVIRQAGINTARGSYLETGLSPTVAS
jgi:hypothetical protein